MRCHYLLEWLDNLLSNTLNPDKSELNSITQEGILLLQSQIKTEEENFCVLLKDEAFRLTKRRKIKLLVKRYYFTLLQLLEEATINFKKLSNDHEEIKRIYNDVISWMRNLFDYIENRFPQYLIFEKRLRNCTLPLFELKKEAATLSDDTIDKSKIKCALSTDQISLILRAADELRIVITKSLNETFKTIVPYLSTPHKETLSYDAVRSKAYVAETRDKEITIEALQNIIQKIKEY